MTVGQIHLIQAIHQVAGSRMKRRQFLKVIPAALVPAFIPAPEPKWGVIETPSGEHVSWYSDRSFDLGTGDYTVEFWSRGGSIDQVRFSKCARIVTSYPEITDCEWHHVAVVQKDGEQTKYLDGQVA